VNQIFNGILWSNGPQGVTTLLSHKKYHQTSQALADKDGPNI